MFLYILYFLTGFYFILMSLFKIPKKFWNQRDIYTQSYIKMALLFFGIGLVISSIYQAYTYYGVGPLLKEKDEGAKSFLEDER